MLDHKENDELNIDFGIAGGSASEDDTELSFMNFSLAAKNTERSKEDKILADLEKMSIFDFTGDQNKEEPETESVIEEVPVEAVSDQEIPEEAGEIPESEAAETPDPEPLPEMISEYSEEPLPELDDVEINVVRWGQGRTSTAPPQKQEPQKPLLIDDTKSVPQIPQSGDEVEVKLCHFRQNAQLRDQKNKEKQKKN